MSRYGLEAVGSIQPLSTEGRPAIRKSWFLTRMSGPGAPAEVVPEPRCHSSVRRAQREAEAPYDDAVEHGDAGNPAAGVLGQHLHLRAATGESSGETGDMPFESAGAREEA